MRWLFYADTPLQLYLSSRIALTELHDGDRAEVLVCTQFPNAEKIAQSLVQADVFTKAHFCKPIGSRMASFKTQMMDFFGKSSFEPSSVIHERYDRLALSIFLDKTMDLITGLKGVNPDLEVILYEDGTGSYDGQAFLSSCYLGAMPNGLQSSSARAKINRLIAKMLPSNRNVCTPIAFFLREPNAYPFAMPFPLQKIKNNPEIANRIAPCFQGDSSPMLEKGVIFLEPPRAPYEHIQDFEALDELIANCHAQGYACTTRSHPRTQAKSPNAHLCTDCSDGLWEIICNQKATGESVLVGAASTAQFTPYLEIGVKPALLFVHRLMIPEGDHYYLAIHDGIVESARRLYGSESTDLICNASSIDEAMEFISHHVI